MVNSMADNGNHHFQSLAMLLEDKIRYNALRRRRVRGMCMRISSVNLWRGIMYSILLSFQISH